MRLPRDVSVEEMRRDCAFYQLPDDVPIQQKRMLLGDAAKVVDECKSQSSRKVEELKAEAKALRDRHFAAAIHASIVENISKSKQLIIDDAFRKKHEGTPGTGMSLANGTFARKCLEDLAREEGFKVELVNNVNGAVHVHYKLM
eukprot:2071459-Amphidinium_carterae.1